VRRFIENGPTWIVAALTTACLPLTIYGDAEFAVVIIVGLVVLERDLHQHLRARSMGSIR
jgi:hypothetical protein